MKLRRIISKLLAAIFVLQQATVPIAYGSYGLQQPLNIDAHRGIPIPHYTLPTELLSAPIHSATLLRATTGLALTPAAVTGKVIPDLNAVDAVDDMRPAISAEQEQLIRENYLNLPMMFIENHGQMDEKVRFYAKQQGMTVWFTDQEIVFDALRPKQNIATNSDGTADVFYYGFQEVNEGVRPVTVVTILGNNTHVSNKYVDNGFAVC